MLGRAKRDREFSEFVLARRQTPADREAEKTSARWITTVDRHVDPGRSFTSGKPTSWGIGSLDKRQRTLIGDLMTSDSWKDGAGIGQVWVSVSRPEYAQPLSEQCGPERSSGFMPYVCSDVVAPNGRPIVTGVASMTVKSFDGTEHRDVPGYFVRYVRPDGQIVMVGVDGSTWCTATTTCRTRRCPVRR